MKTLFYIFCHNLLLSSDDIQYFLNVVILYESLTYFGMYTFYYNLLLNSDNISYQRNELINVYLNNFESFS